MKNSKYIIALFCVSLFSCNKNEDARDCPSVSINQEAEEIDITSGQSKIVTTVSTKNCAGRRISFEYIGFEVVPNGLVDSLRVIEYNKALPKYWQAKKICKCKLD